jgi:DNA helicase II / ATP-dependent DNA helicase PcrA
VVFVVGMEEGLLPLARAVFEDETEDATIAQSLEDELRVAYVAITRPREQLFLSWCRARERNGRLEPRRASRFLRALPSGLLAGAM